MSYYNVLGYKENPIIEAYSDKYFQKLLDILFSIDKDILGDIFWEMDRDKQMSFLLHPDISSLVQDIESQKSQKIFINELDTFCKWDQASLTMNHWNTIPWTNIRLTMSDNNPQNMLIWHPDHDDSGMLWWGEKSEEEWLQVFSNAFEVLKKTNEDFFHELNSIIKKIVPMKTSMGVHNSCSYKECIGTLYLWYTIDAVRPELGILEALIHESSHNKLNLIMQSERLHVNDYKLQYYSPYRPDARHVHWVLLWVHAIVPTVYVMLLAVEKWSITDTLWYEKILVYHMKNKLAYQVLKKYAKFTKIGRDIFRDLAQVIVLTDKKILEIWLQDKVNIKNIQGSVKTHLQQVRINYPSVLV